VWDASAVASFRYEQFCPLARAAEILGERWTLLVLRELACGPQRYSDLRRRLPGLSSSVLSDRLTRLEERGLVARHHQPPPAPAALYQLTVDGEALRPALYQLMRFGVRFLDPLRAGDHLEAEWLKVGLAAFARVGPLPRRTIAIHLADGESEVVLRVTSGPRGTAVEAGSGPAEARVHTAPLTLLGVLARQIDPLEAARSGAIEASGDLTALRDLPDLFDLDDLTARPARTG
jgi:DNA-binding HxlR family transcriptional regulator